MATSGNPVLGSSAIEIVTAALRVIGEIPAEQSPEAVDITTGTEGLNMMVKSWQAQGLHLWAKTEGVLFLDKGKSQYNLGPTGDEATDDDDFINTEIATAAIATDTLIILDSTAGMVGAANTFPNGGPPFINTAGWTVGNSGTVAVVSDRLELTNGAASAGFTEMTITTVVGNDYIIQISYVKGTSVSATFDVRDGATILVTDTLTATGVTELGFTATQTSHTFRFANDSAVITEDSSIIFVKQLDRAAGDNIGIELDDGTRQWTNIVTVDSSTQVRINVALTDAAAVNNSVFTFTDFIDRPLRVLSARREFIGDNSEIPINIWSREDYFNQPDKSGQGTVVNVYYSPQLINGRMYVWQTTNDVDQIVRFTYERPLDIFTQNADSPDFPSEWFEVLKINLAARLAPEYNVDINIWDRLVASGDELLNRILGFDEEPASFSIQPSMRQ